MTIRGRFSVNRDIWDDPNFRKQPFSDREAFMWLLSEASWRARRAEGNYGPIELARGELCHSLRFMAQAFGWPKTRVERFLDRLRKRDVIRATDRDGTRIHFIKDYSRHQIESNQERDSYRDTERDATGTASGQHRDKREAFNHSSTEAVCLGEDLKRSSPTIDDEIPF